MAQQAQSVPIQIHYGHDGTHVLMQFSQPVQMNRMTLEQAEAMRGALGTVIQALRAYQAKQAGN